MVITNIEAKKRALWKDIKKSLKTFIKLYILSNVCYWAFAFLFFYLEHCHDVIPQNLSYSAKRCLQTCQMVHYVNQSINGTPPALMMNLLKVCQEESYCFETESVECSVNVGNILRWIDYVLTIAFTVGEYQELID